jgi:excisionase family DNA binding protein
MHMGTNHPAGAVLDDPPPRDELQTLTLAEVAALLQVTTKTVRKLVLLGELRCLRIGRKVMRFRRAWVQAYLDRAAGGRTR